MTSIHDLFADPAGSGSEDAGVEPDQLATDSLEALRDSELGGGARSDAPIDPALAAVAETGGLDPEDDVDEDFEDFPGSPDALFDSVDEDEDDEDDEEDEDADWDED